MLLDLICKALNFVFGLVPVFTVDLSFVGDIFGKFIGYCVVGFQWYAYLSNKAVLVGCLGTIVAFYVFKGGFFIVKLLIKIFT